MKRFLIAVVLLACCAQPRDASAPPPAARPAQPPHAMVPKDSEPYPPIDVAADLTALHPEIAKSEQFAAWSREHRLTVWHETPLVEGTRTVIAQSADDRLFAALTRLQDDRAELLRTATVDLREARPRRTEAAEEIAKIAPRGSVILAVRPVVTFTPTGWLLKWEFETRDSMLETWQVGADLKVHTLATRPLSQVAPPPMAAPGTPANQWLADDELHHLAAFRSEALGWAAGATSVKDKVARIAAAVRRTYSYDDTIIRITAFTWSDLLVRDTLGRRGICDEWAVVTISYLRSIGIPARQEFLIWRDSHGNPGAHSCAEYFDGSQWQHVDPLWYAYTPNPAVYRSAGYSSITVMDAGDPRDARSTTPAWGEPDPTGDGELNPYCQGSDFVLTPPYPGKPRAGYSY